MSYLNRYTRESDRAKVNAQRNLNGRTHYVNDGNLRFHHARIVRSGITDDGLLFWLIESVALNMENTRRGFRFVVFDVFGRVLSRVGLEDCVSTSGKAEKQLWKFLDTIDAKKVTIEAIGNSALRSEKEFNGMLKELNAK